MLWEDIWKGSILSRKWAELHSLMETIIPLSMRKNLLQITAVFFQLPLSMIAYDQFIILSEQLDKVRGAQERDIWTFMWGQSKNSAKKPMRS